MREVDCVGALGLSPCMSGEVAEVDTLRFDCTVRGAIAGLATRNSSKWGFVPTPDSKASPRRAPPLPRTGGAPQTTVLLVGRGEAMGEAIAAALTRRGLCVESTDSQTAADAVRAAAPDLVLLMGDAANDAGRVVLENFRRPS